MERYQFTTGPIQEVSWGRFVIGGQEHAKLSGGHIVGVGKDIRLIGEHLEAWAERQGHRLTIPMVEKAVQAGVETVIIGNGFLGAVEVPAEVRNYIRQQGKELIVEKTPEACRRFNELLSRGKKVALLAHGTC